MYRMVRREDIIRIPPEMLGEDIDDVAKAIVRQSFESKVGRDKSLTIVTTNVKRMGDGRIVHGDGAVYQKVGYEALVFKPEMQEVVLGTVCEVMKYGAFIRFGPLDGLLHISQVMDDRIEVDVSNERLIGKDTKRDIKIGDTTRTRVVAVSLNELNPRESKIGLTMRQPALGKLEWIEEKKREAKEGSEGKVAEKKEKKGAKKKGGKK